MNTVLKRLADRTPEEWAAHDRELLAERQRDLDAREAKVRAAMVAALEIPPRLLALVTGRLDSTPAMEALADPHLLTCLSGNPGNGKTVAAASWLYGRSVGLFVKAAAMARWERYDQRQMARLLGARALVLDDLGTEYADAKGNFAALFDELLDYRYDHGLPLVVTTNLDAEAFKERYGERIADRIREVGRFVSLGNESLRSRK